MDLIFWRHAEAEDALPGGDDMARTLTPNGEKQARCVATWLERRLPDSTSVLSSPALRATQTVRALQREFKLRGELAPDGAPDQLLDLVQWPDGKLTFLVVGHQPMLGQTIARLLGMQDGVCSIRKGALWWLRRRIDRAGAPRITVVSVVSPDLL